MDFKIQECVYSGYMKDGYDGVIVYFDPKTENNISSSYSLVVDILNGSRLESFLKSSLGYKSSIFGQKDLINIQGKLSKVMRINIATIDNIPVALINNNGDIELITGRYDNTYSFYNENANNLYLTNKYGIQIEDVKELINNYLYKKNIKQM